MLLLKKILYHLGVSHSLMIGSLKMFGIFYTADIHCPWLCLAQNEIWDIALRSLSLHLSLAVASEHLSEVSTITMKTSLCLFAVAKAFVPYKYIFYSLPAAVYWEEMYKNQQVASTVWTYNNVECNLKLANVLLVFFDAKWSSKQSRLLAKQCNRHSTSAMEQEAICMVECSPGSNSPAIYPVNVLKIARRYFFSFRLSTNS